MAWEDYCDVRRGYQKTVFSPPDFLHFMPAVLGKGETSRKLRYTLAGT